MMKKSVIFVSLLGFCVLLGILSAVLRYGLATVGCLVAAIMLMEYHFALKDIHYFNPSRSYYKNKGRLDRYQKNCGFFFICFLALGVVGFILALFQVI